MWRYKLIVQEREHRINEDIRIPKIRLIDADGENKGVVSTQEALEMAQEANLDLVEIVPNGKPPVCRIMDYGKFRFDESKKAAIARKKQKQVQVKEIKFRPGTDDGDYKIKIRKLIEFLDEGDKTKITVRFRGRELAHRELGMELMKRIETDLTEYAVVEQFPKLEGRQMVMVMAPKKK
ncbi:translation initiation factor IF-3 [Thiolinea disciformis]|uniref:translation initiation factor IF-3 n=1 Tax=Thiolinea disciformis TaxID=125614 RepID=UPI001FE00BA7|nr:translation initiation factor IF-3 [Thiolinea disciformis]